VLALRRPGKNASQQFLAANVVPKSSKNNCRHIVTRAVVPQTKDGKWMEILRCDEHLKNQKASCLALPRRCHGWRLAFEQDPRKGLAFVLHTAKRRVDTQPSPSASAGS